MHVILLDISLFFTNTAKLLKKVNCTRQYVSCLFNVFIQFIILYNDEAVEYIFQLLKETVIQFVIIIVWPKCPATSLVLMKKYLSGCIYCMNINFQFLS